MTTKQRDAISTIWQLFRDYFEEGSGSLRSNDDELIEQLDIYAREEKIKLLEGMIEKIQGNLAEIGRAVTTWELEYFAEQDTIKAFLKEELSNLKG